MENKSLRPRHVEHHEIFTEVSMNEDSLDISSTYQDSTSKENNSKVHKIPFIGVFCALFSGIFFATASFIVAFVTNVDPIEILVIRSCTQLMSYVPVVIYNRNSFLGVEGERLFVCMRAVIGTVSMGTGYYSFRLIPLADASTIIFSSPAFVTLFACVLLREPCGMFQVFTIIITLTGVVLISKPTFLFGVSSTDQASSAHRLHGSLMAFCSCIAAALTFISLRKLQKTSTPVVICIFSIVSITSGLIYLSFFSKFSIPTCGEDGVLLILCGLCGTCGQFLLTTALKLEEAGPVSVARTVDVVLAFIFGVSFLNQYPSWTSIVGAFLVCSSVVITAIKKWMYRHKSQNVSLSERKTLTGKNCSSYNTFSSSK
ncbi:solute carrier family 35 member G1-like [Limulus polyphemus]|uniref:Solute carrier family 35 member G1-like n=1 Tax=Limulus polyphemus TaxID=6850 RepID=A0ABM1T3B6_LIMPO|nr:solute carrier family 35 member G1-like [Limulus polyphemus]XP_022250373.1 solute carrier family 35 member G1-like [Limulus polyphemus]XP_022250374.1 solute carrier family 35 member G1-like [Limulus polyphemus]